MQNFRAEHICSAARTQNSDHLKLHQISLPEHNNVTYASPEIPTGACPIFKMVEPRGIPNDNQTLSNP